MTQESFSFKDILKAAFQDRGQSEIERLLLNDSREFYDQFFPCAFQEAALVKNTFIARELAKMLIKESGELDKQKISETLDFLTSNLYPLPEEQVNETPQRIHLLKSLKALKENNVLEGILKKIFCPLHNKIHQLIKNTLLLNQDTVITIQHVRQAAVSALFAYLRQDVGSCFVTAPAIIIHKQYPELFLRDIEKLISTGKLTKLYKQRQITVPINLTGGLGSLKKPVSIYDLFPDPIQMIAGSPGILRALTQIGLIPENHPEAPRICQELLANERIFKLLANPYGTISAEEIIKYCLLHVHNLQEQEIEAHIFLEGIKPVQDLIISGIDSRVQSKAAKISKFIKDYQIAKSVFIGLTVNPLLKAWELSLASLAEIKADLSSSHILIGLGINPTEEHGLGSYLKEAVQTEVEIIESELETYESRYRHVKADLAYIESRSRNPLNKQDAEALSVDFRLKQQELHRTTYEWDECQEKKKRLVRLVSDILKNYKNSIPQYFRGIYDAEMNDVDVSDYKDQPAGFRIYYTHGRSNPTSWTPIYSLQEYIYALTQFLSATEIEITEKPCYEAIKTEISRCIGKIITRIHTEIFQESSFLRVAEYYGQNPPEKPLHSISKISYKPWAYISGGTMESFLCAYFNLSEEPTEIFKHPANPAELAAFFSDSIKDLTGCAHDYLRDPDALFLSASPTHVFLALPGNLSFRESWDNNWYSYSWIRDVWEERHRVFLESILLNEQHITELLKICSKLFPQEPMILQEALNFFEDLNLTIPEFYNKITRFLTHQPWMIQAHNLKQLQKEIAGIIVSHIPLISEQSLPELIDNISQYLGISSKINSQNSLNIIEANIPKFGLLTPNDFRQLYKNLAIHHYNALYMDEHFHLRLVTAMRHYNISYPAPLMIGDSNWNNIFFGFTVHPGTLETDFWSFDYSGINGKPMTEWKKYFSIEERWKLMTDPREYGFQKDFTQEEPNSYFF